METVSLRLTMEQNDLLDNALLFHSFKLHQRDYQLIVAAYEGGRYNLRSYVFKYAVEVSVSNVLPETVYKKSLDDDLLQVNDEGSDGYVWSVNWTNLYPGWTLAEASELTQRWTDKVGMTFHEVVIQTNVQRITIVFSGLLVAELPHVSIDDFYTDTEYLFAGQ